MLAEVDGRRGYRWDRPMITSLCFSQDEVRRRMVEVVVSHAVAHPEVDYLHVWIDDGFSNKCACEECIKVNKKMFVYNDKKQAYIKDPKAGSFRDLVTAAERCPVRIIHPGTPLNPKEKNLDKWVKRAEPFN